MLDIPKCKACFTSCQGAFLICQGDGRSLGRPASREGGSKPTLNAASFLAARIGEMRRLTRWAHPGPHKPGLAYRTAPVLKDRDRSPDEVPERPLHRAS